MIISKKPLTLAEVKEYRKERDEKRPVDDYLASFTKLKKAEAVKMAEELRTLNNPKIRDEQIVKVIDILPEDLEDVNKIFTEINLNAEEADAVLKIVKK